MSLDSVREALATSGKAGDILVFDRSSATVLEAAEAAGVPPERIAKTLGFYGPAPDTAILVVVAGDAKLNSGDFKRRFGLKARMLAADDVERLTGHAIGGVCPFANPHGATVYLDESLRRFDTVFPAAGSSNSAIEVRLNELDQLGRSAGWVDVCRGWRDDESLAGG
jgi:prolyl-tRNA editing enzyme YbaK/EbsC (Cys-tRNA(Pro) deacylase)